MQTYRFNDFEVSPASGELFKRGLKLRLAGQPFEILCLLLERHGQVVTREELRTKLWADVSFVDFEHGVNAAVHILREVLGDSANAPRYIETLPRRGYRFIAPLKPCRDLAPPPRLARQIKSLAVLPLKNISGDPEQARVRVGEVFNDELGTAEPVKVAKLQISEECPNLIRTIGQAPRDEDSREEIAEFLGDDSLQSAGYGLYGMFGKPASIPAEEKAAEKMAAVGIANNPTQINIWRSKLAKQEERKTQPVRFARRRLSRRNQVMY